MSAETCEAVDYDMAGDGLHDTDVWNVGVGDLIWNPKMGDGHVVVALVPCGQQYNGRRVDCGCGGWGQGECPSITPICECGKDGSWRDHHYWVLARHKA